MSAQPDPHAVLDEATRLLMNSVQYLAMANLVIEADDYRANPRRYNRPILNTLAIGIELFLKASHIRAGQAVEEVAKKYRHNIWKLWEDCPDPEPIEQVMKFAEASYAQAILNGHAPPIDHLQDEFRKALRNLSKLHTVNGSLLRYLAPAGTQATAPGWLVQTFYMIADASLRRPPFGS